MVIGYCEVMGCWWVCWGSWVGVSWVCILWGWFFGVVVVVCGMWDWKCGVGWVGVCESCCE